LNSNTAAVVIEGATQVDVDYATSAKRWIKVTGILSAELDIAPKDEEQNGSGDVFHGEGSLGSIGWSKIEGSGTCVFILCAHTSGGTALHRWCGWLLKSYLHIKACHNWYLNFMISF